jgi:hypothetical protein
MSVDQRRPARRRLMIGISVVLAATAVVLGLGPPTV